MSSGLVGYDDDGLLLLAFKRCIVGDPQVGEKPSFWFVACLYLPL